MTKYNYNTLSNCSDEETGLIDNNNNNNDNDLRVLMIRVYSLLSLQLVITFCVTLLMYINKTYIVSHLDDYLIFSVVINVLLLITMCNTKGYVKLGLSLLFAMSAGILIGIIAVLYDVIILMHTIFITLVTIIFCTLFVYITKVNLHSWKNVLLVYLVVVLIANSTFIFFPVDDAFHVLLSISGILMFVGFMLYDTSELFNNYSNDNDYVDIATRLYINIMGLFIFVAQFVLQASVNIIDKIKNRT